MAVSILTHNKKDWIIKKNRITNSRNCISKKDWNICCCRINWNILPPLIPENVIEFIQQMKLELCW